jgi:hypothetical protein
MARSIATEISIGAPPEAVWRAIVDFSRQDWNPLFASVSGVVAVGEPLRFVLRKPRFTIRPRITAAEPARLLEWRGHLGMPGLVDGHHAFELQPIAPGTRLLHRETFSGLLVPLMGGVLAQTERTFAAFNQALKTHVEGRPAGAAR